MVADVGQEEGASGSPDSRRRKPSDIGTKVLTRERFEKLLALMGIKQLDTSSWKEEKCAKVVGGVCPAIVRTP